MEILDRIQIGKFTRIGISKKGKIHYGYWDDDWDRMKWIPKDVLIKKTKNKKLKERLKLGV